MIVQFALVPFVLSLFISAAITYITINLYRFLGLEDKSTKKQHAKHIHVKPVPRGGGIPIFLAMLFVTLTLIKIDAQIAGVFLGALIIMVTGVVDDIYDISPYLRLIIGLIAALIVVSTGIGINYVSNPLGVGVIHFNLQIVTDALTILWIVWGMNFVNMGAKGLDGQLPGVTMIAAIVMGILSTRFASDINSWPSTYLSFSLAGAYTGLLIFNKYPQKIMPGWGGGALSGYFLAVLAIMSGAKVATALIVLGVPLMDVIYVIARRISAHKSPVWGDTNHLHHQLLKLGFTKSQVALFYWVVTAVLGYIALQLNSQMKIYTILLIAVTVGGALLWINLFLSQKQSE